MKKDKMVALRQGDRTLRGRIVKLSARELRIELVDSECQKLSIYRNRFSGNPPPPDLIDSEGELTTSGRQFAGKLLLRLHTYCEKSHQVQEELEELYAPSKLQIEELCRSFKRSVPDYRSAAVQDMSKLERRQALLHEIQDILQKCYIEMARRYDWIEEEGYELFGQLIWSLFGSDDCLLGHD